MSVRKVILVTGKGGVGKTTVAVNSAVLLTRQGYRVGLLDADIHCPDIPNLLGMKPCGIDGLLERIQPASPMDKLKVVSMALFLHKQDTPLAWRGPIKQGVIRQFISDSAWGELDFLIVDLPAGTGDEAMSAVTFLRDLTGVFVVTTPHALSRVDGKRIASFYRHNNIPVLGVIENMVDMECSRCHHPLAPFGKAQGEILAADLEVPYLGSIPVDSEIGECADRGEPFVAALPDSAPAMRLREILERGLASLEERLSKTVVATLIYG